MLKSIESISEVFYLERLMINKNIMVVTCLRDVVKCKVNTQNAKKCVKGCSCKCKKIIIHRTSFKRKKGHHVRTFLVVSTKPLCITRRTWQIRRVT